MLSRHDAQLPGLLALRIIGRCHTQRVVLCPRTLPARKICQLDIGTSTHLEIVGRRSVPNISLEPARRTLEFCPERRRSSSDFLGGRYKTLLVSESRMSLVRCDLKHIGSSQRRLHGECDTNLSLGTKRIDHFERTSSQLRAYFEYIHYLKQKHGSVLSYIQHERLCWESTTPSGERRFTNSDDFRILCNDWPYYIDEDITHLVVWTKFLIDEDETGDVTDEAKADVENFIDATFCSRGPSHAFQIKREQIIWFKNWGSLKSVHALGKSAEKTPEQGCVSFGSRTIRALPCHDLSSTSRPVGFGYGRGSTTVRKLVGRMHVIRRR